MRFQPSITPNTMSNDPMIAEDATGPLLSFRRHNLGGDRRFHPPRVGTAGGQLGPIEDEATVYDFCTQLLTTRQVSDKNFKAMTDLVGERGIVELVALMGQYTGLTMLFVVDRYPVPTGAPDEVNKPM